MPSLLSGLLFYTMSCGEDNDWLAGEQDSTATTKRIVRLQQSNLETHSDETIILM